MRGGSTGSGRSRSRGRGLPCAASACVCAASNFQAGLTRLSLRAVCALQLHRITVDLGSLADAYTKPGQFVQIKVGRCCTCSALPATRGLLHGCLPPPPGSLTPLPCVPPGWGNNPTTTATSSRDLYSSLQVGDSKPGFFAIASPPDPNNAGVVELLIKDQGGAAELLCKANAGGWVGGLVCCYPWRACRVVAWRTEAEM